MAYETFRAVIDAWPSRAAFAADLGVRASAVHKMHEVDSIRGVYFQAIVDGAARLEIVPAITPGDLCRLAARARRMALVNLRAAE